MHSNHFWEIWPLCPSKRAPRLMYLRPMFWEQTLCWVVIIWNQKLFFFYNLFWTTLWLVHVDSLTDITPAVFQIFYVFEQRLSVSSNSLLNKHRKIWRSTKYCALNCHICRQNNTVNDSLYCVRASTPLRLQIRIEQMFHVCWSVGKDTWHSVLTQELMICTPNWPVEKGK